MLTAEQFGATVEPPVTRQQVHKWIKIGMPYLRGGGRNRKGILIDENEAVEWLGDRGIRRRLVVPAEHASNERLSGKAQAMRTQLASNGSYSLHGPERGSMATPPAYDRSAEPPLKFTMEFITPYTAEEYLKLRHPDQRRIRKHRVRQYVRDLEAKRWVITHEGVAFDSRGRLIDGQHRLMAIVCAGVGVWMLVARAVAEDAIGYIGGQLKRSAAESLYMAGYKRVTRITTSTARAMQDGPGARSRNAAAKMTNAELNDFIQTHEEALAFVEEQFPGKTTRGVTASVRAVVARAFNHVDRERLCEWCSVVKSGMPVSQNYEEDAAAIVFRNAILEKVGRSGVEEEVKRYAITQTSIRHFVDRNSKAHLKGTDLDLFPLVPDA